jgi:hypothetical protein
MAIQIIYVAFACMPLDAEGTRPKSAELCGVFQTLQGAKDYLEEKFDKLCSAYPKAKMLAWQDCDRMWIACVENIYDGPLLDFFTIRQQVLR